MLIENINRKKIEDIALAMELIPFTLRDEIKLKKIEENFQIKILKIYNNAFNFNIDAFIGKKQDNTLIVCLKEMDSIIDLFIELDINKSIKGIARGFYSAAFQLYVDIMQNFKFSNCFVCGYSKGGSLAQALGLLISNSRKKTTCVSIAGSKVFTKNKVNKLLADNQFLDSINVINRNDFWTKYPTFKYKHYNPVYLEKPTLFCRSIQDHLFKNYKALLACVFKSYEI